MVKVYAVCGLRKTGLSPGSFHAAPRSQQLRHAPQLPGTMPDGFFTKTIPGAALPGRFMCGLGGMGAGGMWNQARRRVSPPNTENTKKTPFSFKNPAKIKKAIFNFIKAPCGLCYINTAMFNYVSDSVLTHR